MKSSVLQIRIDDDKKEEAEILFSSMGTSLSEAVRVFIQQSLLEQQFPFPVKSATKTGEGKAFAALALYVHPVSREMEREAWLSSLKKKR